MTKIGLIGIGGLHRGLTIPEIYIENTKLHDEVIALRKQKSDVVKCCKNSIKSINDRLAWVDTKRTYPDKYERVRLKAFRTKCKEILRMLGESNE